MHKDWIPRSPFSFPGLSIHVIVKIEGFHALRQIITWQNVIPTETYPRMVQTFPNAFGRPEKYPKNHRRILHYILSMNSLVGGFTWLGLRNRAEDNVKMQSVLAVSILSSPFYGLMATFPVFLLAFHILLFIYISM